MKFKVLITTSGIGSRLGEYTRYTNKTLLRIGKKPVISHIIEGYPVDTHFVVTLGYFGEQVKNYLEIAYPNRIFEFVVVDNFQGDGSSLLYSMTCAKDKLQLPFIFHASDTIVQDNLPIPNYNWNAGFSGSGSSHYSSFDVSGNNVNVFYEKGNLSPDFLHIGIVGINNYELFWRLAEKTLNENEYSHSLSDIDVLKQFINTDKVLLTHCKTWFDVGNVEKIKEAKKYFSDSKFHVLDKVTESIYNVEGSIIKFFYDDEVCQNRVKRTAFLKGAVPSITESRPNFYKYPYVEGELFANIANLSNFNFFLEWAFENLWNPVKSINKESFEKVSYDFYYSKTLKRISEFQKSRGIQDKEEEINGFVIPSIEDLLKSVDFVNLSQNTPTTFHGDFILDNIIFQNKSQYKLIDWRQDFGGEIEAGDQYYDLAKLAHNLVVNHEIIDNDNFTFKVNRDSIIVNIHRHQLLVECENFFFTYLQKRGVDVKKVKLLRAIIWLNMSPLHHHPFDMFLYYFGKYNLYKELNKLNYDF
jgi:NDP-sugar pyrophosphorylase family protein/thiamine kinase-like enzyme